MDRRTRKRLANSPEDHELLSRIARGDRRAFSELFKRYHANVVQFSRRRLQDPGAAEEAADETFVAIWRNAGRFRGDSLASTWIYGVAHFKCMAASRARRRKKRAAVIPIDNASLARVADDRPLGARIEARDEIRRVEAAIHEMPIAHRQVLEMAFFEERPYGEIATRLGIREDTVKTRVARARARLRRSFRPQPDARPEVVAAN